MDRAAIGFSPFWKQTLHIIVFKFVDRQGTAGTTLTVRVATNARVDHPSRVQTGTVDRTFVHPEYDPESQNFDIALLKMRGDFQLNDYVQTVCVPTADLDDRFDKGSMCTATGWGARFEGGLFLK